MRAGQETRQASPGSVAEQARISSCTPLAVASAGSARHRPECGFASMAPAPSGTRFHCCPGLPLQECRSTSVPLATPEPVTSRHLPLTVTVPSGFTFQACPAEPLHAQISILVPSAVWFPLSSTQLPWICDAIGPGGSDHAPNAMDNFCFDVTLSYRRLERPRRPEGSKR